MILPEQVYLAVEPVDMRWGIERLSCHVQHAIGRTPCDGSAFAFTNRQRSRLKLLVWDATAPSASRHVSLAEGWGCRLHAERPDLAVAGCWYRMAATRSSTACALEHLTNSAETLAE